MAWRETLRRSMPCLSRVRRSGPRAGLENSRPTKFFIVSFSMGGILGLCVLHVLENIQDRPAARLCHLAERGAGIGGDRIGDGFEQRQVVGRVAVEIRALEGFQAQ